MPMNLPCFRATILYIVCCPFLLLLVACTSQTQTKEEQTKTSGIAVLLVDTDHPLSVVDKNIYGHFLEHINHSVEDGLYAEQVQGQGFEAKDFETYWKPVEKNGKVNLVDIP